MFGVGRGGKVLLGTQKHTYLSRVESAVYPATCESCSFITVTELGRKAGLLSRGGQGIHSYVPFYSSQIPGTFPCALCCFPLYILSCERYQGKLIYLAMILKKISSGRKLLQSLKDHQAGGQHHPDLLQDAWTERAITVERAITITGLLLSC